MSNLNTVFVAAPGDVSRKKRLTGSICFFIAKELILVLVNTLMLFKNLFCRVQ